MSNPYTHHVPGKQATFDLAALRDKFAALHSYIEGVGVPSRERSLALTKLQEASMWANLAAVLADPESVPETP